VIICVYNLIIFTLRCITPKKLHQHLSNFILISTFLSWRCIYCSKLNTVTECYINIVLLSTRGSAQTCPDEPWHSQRVRGRFLLSSIRKGRESAEEKETVSMELFLHHQECFFCFSSFSHLSATDCPEEEEEEEEEEVTTVLYTEAFLPNYVWKLSCSRSWVYSSGSGAYHWCLWRGDHQLCDREEEV